MAKYNVTYACGHVAEKQLYGRMDDRQRDLAWAARSANCPSCRQAGTDQAIIDIEAEHELPALTGSAKQTKWGREIRAEKIAAVVEFVQKNRPATMTAESSQRKLSIWREISRSVSRAVMEFPISTTGRPVRYSQPPPRRKGSKICARWASTIRLAETSSFRPADLDRQLKHGAADDRYLRYHEPSARRCAEAAQGVRLQSGPRPRRRTFADLAALAGWMEVGTAGDDPPGGSVARADRVRSIPI